MVEKRIGGRGTSLSFIIDIVRSPQSVSVRGHIPLPSFVCSAPSQETIKSNVDSFYSLGSNTSGIDGIFRDHEGVSLLHFAKNVSTDSTIQTEDLVMR